LQASMLTITPRGPLGKLNITIFTHVKVVK